MPADFSQHACTPVEQYRIQGDVHGLTVRASSPYVGLARESIDLRAYPAVRLICLGSAVRISIVAGGREVFHQESISCQEGLLPRPSLP